MALEIVQLLVRHLAGRVHADAFEHVDDGDVAALESAGQDRAAVHEDGRHVEAQHRHHDAGQRLVAAGDADDRVVAVAAHGELDRIGDHLARDERRLHALVTHGDAVGHGDGAELARGAAGFVDAELGRLRLAHQRDVAGGGFVPARHDADERAMDLLLFQPHGIVVGAMRRARRPFGHVPAGKLRFVERLGVHAEITFLAGYRPNTGHEVLARLTQTDRAVATRVSFAVRPPGHSARFPLDCRYGENCRPFVAQ